MGEHLNMTAILATHGHSLEELTIHEFERDCTYSTGNATWGRPFLSVAELDEIRIKAPLLRSLSVDVYRSVNKWPNKIFDTLSAFPNLEQLNLHFDAENPLEKKIAEACYTREIYCIINEAITPLLNRTSATEIFHRLSLHQSSKKLEKVSLYVGDYDRREGGGMRIESYDDKSLRPIHYECSLQGDSRVEICDREDRSIFDEFDITENDFED
jgi:hypothetical protein